MAAAGSATGVLRHLQARLRAHPHHASILAGLVTVTAFVAMAKLVAALKEVVVAARFGVGPTMDAYALLTNVIAWPVSLSASIAMTALTPLVIRAREGDAAGAEDFQREAWTVTALAAALASLGAMVALPWLLRVGALGATPSVTRAALAQSGLLAFTLGLGLAYGLLAAFLMAGRSYANSLIDGAPALVILVVLVLSPPGAAAWLVWATLGGAAAQVLLAMAAQGRGIGALRPRLSLASPLWRPAIRHCATVALGVAAMSASNVVDQMVAARLGAGANSTLGYATRLTGLVVSLGALAVSRALLPALSQVADDRARRRVAFQWSALLFAAGLIAALAGWTAAPLGIRLFYQHGQFHAADTVAVAGLFRLSLTQLPFYFAGMAMVQLLASSGDYKAFAVIGAGALVVKIAAVAALAPVFGLSGVVLSTALMYLFTFAALCWRLGRGAPT